MKLPLKKFSLVSYFFNLRLCYTRVNKAVATSRISKGTMTCTTHETVLHCSMATVHQKIFDKRCLTIFLYISENAALNALEHLHNITYSLMKVQEMIVFTNLTGNTKLMAKLSFPSSELTKNFGYRSCLYSTCKRHGIRFIR